MKSAFVQISDILSQSIGEGALNAPATDGQLKDLQKFFPVDIPESVLEAYRAGNGEAELSRGSAERYAYIFGEIGIVFLSTDGCIDWLREVETLIGFSDPELGYIDDDKESFPPNAINPYSHSKLWLPIAKSLIADIFISIDFDPAKAGTVGQVILHGGAVRSYLLANSFDEFCEKIYRLYMAKEMHRVLKGEDAYDPENDSLVSRCENGLF